MARRRTTRRAARNALETGHAAVDTAMTLATRLPLFAHGVMVPNAAADTEWNRAVREKVVASFEGAVEAGFAWQRFWLGAMMRPPGLAAFPAAFATACAEATEAAMRPARKTVAANARRLTR